MPGTHHARLIPTGVLLVLIIAAPHPVLAQAINVGVTLRDASTLAPVRDAAVRFDPAGNTAVSDSTGRFTIQLRPGTYEITVEHVAYGSHATVWTLPADSAALTIEIRLDQQAITLAEVRADAPLSREEWERRAEGAVVRRISREQLDEESQRGRKLADVLRNRIIGLRIKEGVFFTSDNTVPTRILCLESGSRGRASLYTAPSGGGGSRPVPGRTRARGCNMVPVFRDGIRLFDPGSMLIGYSLEDLDRVEWLSVAAAAARFGLQAENKGALLLYTRTGAR